MGKRSWFSAMKKAMRASSKKEKRSPKSNSSPKNSLNVSLDACSSHTQPALANPLDQYHLITEREFNLPENEDIKHVDSVTYTTTVVQDADVKCTTSNSCFLGKTTEEAGAIKIQTAYRGYTARKAFRSLRAMSRLNLWIQGQAVKQQTAFTLMRIQKMGRVQSQVRTRKTRTAEVNQALKRQQRQKRQVLEKQAFDLSPRSKEQVDAMLRNRKQASERREKALAYAKIRQQEWRNSQKSVPAFEWNWSWSNRWDANRPWETKSPVKRQVSPSKSVSTGQRVKPTNNKSQILKAVPAKRNLVTKSLSTRGKLTTCAPMVLVR
ncbi:protein IQ-DOMAIN 2-like [Bidens hawaiensis]|uniref:protein IQ-DOMAIN 2-like n=1 Tax=Bidens hawaiensis TaxID=980011 RepID=UPI00404996DE